MKKYPFPLQISLKSHLCKFSSERTQIRESKGFLKSSEETQIPFPKLRVALVSIGVLDSSNLSIFLGYLRNCWGHCFQPTLLFFSLY